MAVELTGLTYPLTKLTKLGTATITPRRGGQASNQARA